jgi:hypothetical protein
MQINASVLMITSRDNTGDAGGMRPLQIQVQDWSVAVSWLA